MQQIRSALSLFNGISGLHLALDKAQISAEQVYYSEIDKFANKVTEQHYPNDIALGDVTKWKDWDIDWSTVDLVSAGFPCFTGDTLVLTSDGYKEISKINLGDLVLTHTNTWKPVVTLFEKENYIWEIKAQGLVKTQTTEEHPFLISKMSRVYNSETKRCERNFSTPDWVEVKDIKRGDFVCYPKIQEQENPLGLSEDDCYILGRYIADGHTAKHNRSEVGRENDRVWALILSVGSGKIPKVETKCHIHQHTRNTHRMVFSNKRLVELAEAYCGIGAKNKEISPTLLKLPHNLLQKVVDGILDGDGSSKDGVYQLTSISLKLVNSLNLAIMKLYGVVGSITFTERPKTTVIEGRTVNQQDTYTIRFSKEHRKQVKFSEIEDYFVAPVSSVVKTDVIKPVYNIEVDGDNSYTVNNCIVHNCQAWSVAGKQLGDKDERGMLFWTTLEIIAHVLKHNPSAKFLMENVKMKKDFEQYITYHTEQALGYVEKTLINSSLVSAQNRNRYYWTNFEVTQPDDIGILLKDILEQDSNPIYKELESDIRSRKVKTEQFLNGESQTMRRALANGKNPDQKANTLTSCAYKGMGTNGMTNVVVRATVQTNAEHTYNGKSPTLTSSKYKGKYIDKHERLEYRKLTPLECERLQTVPDNWTECLSNTQRYKSLGNGWTIDVIVHILECAYK